MPSLEFLYGLPDDEVLELDPESVLERMEPDVTADDTGKLVQIWCHTAVPMTDLAEQHADSAIEHLAEAFGEHTYDGDGFIDANAALDKRRQALIDIVKGAYASLGYLMTGSLVGREVYLLDFDPEGDESIHDYSRPVWTDLNLTKRGKPVFERWWTDSNYALDERLHDHEKVWS